MTELRYEIPIAAPADRVWEVIADFGNIYRFNPNVSASHLTSTRDRGIDTTRHCDLAFPGASVEERILEWNDGEQYAVEIYDGQKIPPFKTTRATVGVRPDGPDRAIGTAELAYELKYGPAGALMNRVMVEPKFGPAFGSLLAGLKHYMETGEEVNGDTDLSDELDALRVATTAAAA